MIVILFILLFFVLSRIFPVIPHFLFGHKILVLLREKESGDLINPSGVISLCLNGRKKKNTGNHCYLFVPRNRITNLVILEANNILAEMQINPEIKKDWVIDCVMPKEAAKNEENQKTDGENQEQPKQKE